MDPTEWLLTGLLNYGTTALALTLFLAALGIPLPATILLMAAGAFAQQDMMRVDTTFVAALTAAVSGDGASYLLGRFAIRRTPARLRQSPTWVRATALFKRWGSSSIILTRFLLTPLALPVNLLAGSARYSVSRFLVAVLIGETLWVTLIGGIGYTFANQWEWLSRMVVDFVGLLVGMGLVLAGAMALVAQMRRPRTSSPRSSP